MALAPDSILLSNDNVITFETLGPKYRAILKNAAGETLYTGDYTFSASKEILAQAAINAKYPDEVVSIAESNIVPPPTPSKPTPQQIEQNRQDAAAARQTAQNNTRLQQIPSSTIEQGTPDSLKPKGRAKLGQIILNAVKPAVQLIIPKIEELAIEYGLEQFEQLKDQATSPEQIEALKQRFCPLPERLDRLIELRNNIVTQLNSIGDRLSSIQVSIEVGTGVKDAFQQIVNAINIVRPTIQSAAAVAPLANILGPLTVSLDRLQGIVDNIEPKLQNTTFSLDAVFPPIAVVVEIIDKIVVLLGKFDILIKLCRPSASLTAINDNVNIFKSSGVINSAGSYKGFTFEIVTEAFSPTVNRIKAIAVNQSGVPLLETGLSFTTDSQTLIDELKLIIDRDNLKAY